MTSPRSAAGRAARLIPWLLTALLSVPLSVARAQSPWLTDGDYTHGWLYHDETFESWEQTMPLDVRIDYPALSQGEDSPVATAGGPFPIIVFEHAGGSWYDNYDYLFRRLATRGFVVISGCHDECGNWGDWPDDEYRTKHADLFRAMLALLLDWNETPGSPLEARLDPARISLAGHSHGGGAALDALTTYRPVDPDAALEIRTVLLLAPCPWDFAIGDYPQLYPVVPPLQVVYGARDTDVCVADGQSVGIYEVGARPRHYAYVDGADHYAFTDRGGLGISTIPRTQAQEAAASAIVAYYEYMLHGNAAALPYLRGTSLLLPGPPERTYQFHETERRVIDDFESADNALGFAAQATDLLTFARGSLDRPADALYSPTGGLEVAWESAPAAGFREPLAQPPAALDGSMWSDLSLRVTQVYDDPLNPGGGTKDFTIELADLAGQSAALPLSHAAQGALRYPFEPGGFGPKSVLETYRLPLASFKAANPALALEQLVALDFRLGDETVGRLALDDIEFAGCLLAPVGQVSWLNVSRFPGNNLRIRWAPVAGAVSYRVARGEIGSFYDHRIDASLGAGQCDTGGNTRFNDTDDLLLPGSFYYLVSPLDGCGRVAGWGPDSRGNARPGPTVPAPCP